MKKLLKRTLFFTVCFIFAFQGLFACGGQTADNGDGGEELPYGMKQFYEPTSWTPKKLTSNGVALSEYKIIVPSGTFLKRGDGAIIKDHASKELQKYIKKATGITLEIYEDTISPSKYEILLGKVDRQETSDDSVFSGLSKQDFIIKSVNEKLVFYANDGFGALYAVYEYLYELGYRFYAMDYADNYNSAFYDYDKHSIEKIPDASEVFIASDADFTFKPVMTYREGGSSCFSNPEFSVKNLCSSALEFLGTSKTAYGGLNSFAGGGAYAVHSFFDNGIIARGAYFGLLPYSLYSSHPEYFSLVNGVRVYTGGQPCLTNPDVLDVVYKNAINLLGSNDNYKLISVSQNDGGTFCQCENCKKSYEKYGETGTLLNFVNEIARRVKEDAGREDVIVETLAYGNTIELPKKDQNGNYTVVPADNVQIRLCLHGCVIHADENECENWASALQSLHNWSSISKRLSLYYYASEWNSLFNVYPQYNSYYYMYHNLGLNNVTGVYVEGYPFNNPEFAELKAYLLAKLACNPLMSREEYLYHMYDFMQGYYGNGWENILKYINMTQNIMLQTGEEKQAPHYFSASPVKGVIPFSTDKDGNYSKPWVADIIELWDDAEYSAKRDKNGKTSSEQDRVKKSRLHWDYLYISNIYRPDLSGQALMDFAETAQSVYNGFFTYNCVNFSPKKTINPDIQAFVLDPELWLK